MSESIWQPMPECDVLIIPHGGQDNPLALSIYYSHPSRVSQGFCNRSMRPIDNNDSLSSRRVPPSMICLSSTLSAQIGNLWEKIFGLYSTCISYYTIYIMIAQQYSTISNCSTQPHWRHSSSSDTLACGLGAQTHSYTTNSAAFCSRISTTYHTYMCIAC